MSCQVIQLPNSLSHPGPDCILKYYCNFKSVTWTPLKTKGELGRSGRISSSCSTSGTRCVNLVTDLMTSREWRKDQEAFTICFVDRCWSFFFMLSVLLWFTDSDYPFGIFKLFLSLLYKFSSSCSTSGTRCVNLVTDLMTSREWRKDQEAFTISGTYPWSFVTQIFHNGRPSHGGQFWWWKKPEYPERTTNHDQATGKLYHLRLRVECTFFCNLQSRARTHTVLVIDLYELLGNPTT
jgi:hypothetical protein